jgi:hypothetical protein
MEELGEAMVGGWKNKSKKEKMQSITGSMQGVTLNFRTLAGRERGSSKVSGRIVYQGEWAYSVSNSVSNVLHLYKY